MVDAGLVLDDRTKISKHSLYGGDLSVMDSWDLVTRYGCSTREITIYHLLVVDPCRNEWSGDIIEFGEWRNLDKDEIEQCKEFLKEKGYL